MPRTEFVDVSFGAVGKLDDWSPNWRLSVIVLFETIAILLAGCAAVGFLLGRIIRGRKPVIERLRPRIAISTDYLRDAQDKSSSPHTRMRCAFEAIYFCLCELVVETDFSLDNIAHPNLDVAERGMAALNASETDLRELKAMLAWASSMTASLPSTSIEDACALAKRINVATVSLLS